MVIARRGDGSPQQILMMIYRAQEATVWPQKMLIDWVRVYKADLPSTVTLIAETGRNLEYNRIIQSQEFQGNEVTADLDSTAVPALEGSQVLQVDYTNSKTGNPSGANAGFGGIFFNFNSADATYFTNLVFSIDTSAFPGFDDMSIEVKDTSDTALQVLLSSYTPIAVSGNWETYSIPFSAFAGVDISKILFLGFLNPVNEFDQLISGTLYIDDIRLVNQACAPNASVEFDAINYKPDASLAQLIVNDTCAANSVVPVKVETGTEEIVVGVDLDAAGHGETIFTFVSPVSVCPASDENSTIALSDPLIATYINTYRSPGGTERIDTATATAGIDPNAIATIFVGEPSYIIATDPGQPLAFAIDTDFTVSDFSSGSQFDGNFTGDATFSPVWSISNAADTAAVFALPDFRAGFTSGQESINFKVKNMPNDVVIVKFGDGDPDFPVDLTDVSLSTPLGDGWYEVSIPMSNFPTPEAYNYLVIKSQVSTQPVQFLVTDIFLAASLGSVGPECAAPTTAAPTPTEDPADVISLLNSGNVYTNVVVDTWAQFGNAALLETTLDGTDIKRYSNLGFVGVFTGTTPVDISQMTNLRIDVWSAGVTELEVKLVDFLADNTDGTISEDSVLLPLAEGQWVSLDIPLSDFTLANNTDIQQLIFAATGGSGTIFIGNVYYYAVLDPATGGSVPDATILEADGSMADLAAGFTGFDSQTGTAIVSDSSYTQALEVTVADGYAPGVLNLAQLFITGLSSLDSYDEFLFKVKGLTDNNLVLKIEPPGGPDVAIDLASPGLGITVEDLGDGWSQVVVSLAQFGDLSGANVVILQTLDNAYALGDTFLLTDIGFNNAGGGTATGGSVPDATILEADGSMADLAAGFTGFDSQTGTAIVSDSSYTQALEVTVADGYAPGVLNLAQLFITGLSSLDSYDEFLFKVKGLTDNNLVLKIEPPGGPDVAIDLASPGLGITVEDLGDGWSQVVVSLAQFGDLSGANVVILQTLDNAYALGDTFLLTDIGFNNAGGGTATGGSVPDATILEADGSMADLAAGFTGFDSQTGTAIVSDSSYTQALEVTVADGYAPGVLNLAQLFITGLSSLDSYDEFLFKVKGLTDNNLVLKIEPPGGPDVAIDLASPGLGITVEDLGDGWSQVVVSLAQFGDLSGANVVILQTLDNAYALGDTFLLTDIGFNNAGGGGPGPGGTPGTFENGDFETGDLTGWTQTPDGGTISFQTGVTLNGRTGGTWARLEAAGGSVAQDVLLSQVDLEAGVIDTNDQVTVSYDLTGSLAGAGGVVFVELIPRNGSGGQTGSYSIGPFPAFPTAVWETYGDTVTITQTTADLAGGITLQLKASCGPVPGCGVDAYFDNVTFSVTP